jgi:hypothetical protein
MVALTLGPAIGVKAAPPSSSLLAPPSPTESPTATPTPSPAPDTVPPAFPYLQPSDIIRDQAMIGAQHLLPAARIAAADITATDFGQYTLNRIRLTPESIDLNSGVFRVFLFGNQHIFITEASNPFSVYVGQNAGGQPVYNVATFDNVEAVPSSSGYIVPPKSAFNVKNSGSNSETVGTWQRDWWWEVDKANDYKDCPSCTAYDYYRYYAKVRGGVLQEHAGDPNAGYKRLWIEIDRLNTGWTTTGMVEFESAEPEESVAGPNNVDVTVGFGTTYSVNIGVGPIGAGAASSSSYGGTMHLSTEWWHPIIRSELGSGGVQWCRYQSAEFGGTKSIAARTSIRVGATASYGGYQTLRGMQDFTSSCPAV